MSVSLGIECGSGAAKVGDKHVRLTGHPTIEATAGILQNIEAAHERPQRLAQPHHFGFPCFTAP